MSTTTTTAREHSADGTPVVAAVPGRPFGLVRHSLVMARRSLIKTMRTPEQLLDVTLQPIIFIVIFVYLLGGAVAGDRHAYMEFLLPALMVQNVLFASAPTGVSLNTDIKTGVFDRFRSLPIGRSAPLIGGVLGDMIRFVVSIAVMLGFGALLGFRTTTSFGEVLAACLLVMFLAFCFSWMFVLLGMIVREPGAVQGLGFVIMFPLTFGTNVLVPTDTLPGWLQAWVKINPVADAMQAARGLMVGQGPVGEPVLKTLIWSVAILAVFAPLAVRAYRRKA
ncbi:ABC transporter permease [Dactylosporangium sp. CA-233914]|uniref:ABC transporter permease n=1 Tax=Dactylosporangium sp. CA-233914 TaxID=3239934 RepID=UPI003D91D6A4